MAYVCVHSQGNIGCSCIRAGFGTRVHVSTHDKDTITKTPSIKYTWKLSVTKSWNRGKRMSDYGNGFSPSPAEVRFDVVYAKLIYLEPN